MCYHAKQTKEIVFNGMNRKNYKIGQRKKITTSKNRQTNKTATKQQQNSI